MILAQGTKSRNSVVCEQRERSHTTRQSSALEVDANLSFQDQYFCSQSIITNDEVSMFRMSEEGNEKERKVFTSLYVNRKSGHIPHDKVLLWRWTQI